MNDQPRLEAAARRALDSLNDLIANTTDPGVEALGARHELQTALIAAPLDRAAADTQQADLQAEMAKLMRWHREDGDALTEMRSTVERLRAELAEEKASHDPRLRCLLIKAAPDKDLYVGWSNVVEAPAGVWSREAAIAYGFPPSRLDRADETGTSSLDGDGAWDDWGYIAEQRGTLRRDRLGDFAVEYLHGDRQAAYALLEPFEGETEVRR